MEPPLRQLSVKFTFRLLHVTKKWHLVVCPPPPPMVWFSKSAYIWKLELLNSLDSWKVETKILIKLMYLHRYLSNIFWQLFQKMQESAFPLSQRAIIKESPTPFFQIGKWWQGIYGGIDGDSYGLWMETATDCKETKIFHVYTYHSNLFYSHYNMNIYIYILWNIDTLSAWSRRW